MLPQTHLQSRGLPVTSSARTADNSLECPGWPPELPAAGGGSPIINTSVMPEDIARDVRYTNHDRRADGDRCELTLAFLDETQAPPQEAARCHQWTISQSQFAECRGKEQRLEEELRTTYLELLLGRVAIELHRTKTVLVRVNGRVVRRRS